MIRKLCPIKISNLLSENLFMFFLVKINNFIKDFNFINIFDLILYYLSSNFIYSLSSYYLKNQNYNSLLKNSFNQPYLQ